MDGYLASDGRAATAVVSSLSGLSQPDRATCQQTLDQLDGGGGPSAYLDVATATPDPVLAELLMDLAPVAADALAACVNGSDDTATTFAALRTTLDYISLRRSELDRAG